MTLNDNHFWQSPKSFIPTGEQEKLAKKFRIDSRILHLLSLRGVEGEGAISEFVQPSLAMLPDPFTMKDMQKAVLLVSEAIKNDSAICIWGDYDVDGITGTCLLVNFFKQLDVKATYYIPDRFIEGYGLNSRGIERLRAAVPSANPLLITVDCGITNPDETKRAKELGFQMIITDHHLPQDKILDADAVLNVKQSDCPFPDKNLAGVGTAFYLAAGIRSYLQRQEFFSGERQAPNLKQFLDLVAIGTIADMVPLTGLNRILVRSGFEVLAGPTQTGVSALLRSSDITTNMLVSDDIAFQIAPKINAAGRMGKTEAALDLLLCTDANKAATLANQLAGLNNKRKKLCADTLEYTLNIAKNKLKSDDKCIVLSGDYHQGVIGIVASQLSQLYQLPTILFTHDLSQKERNILKGSGRSVPGIDLFGVLRQCERYLLHFGGHPMAAGLSILEENLAKFSEYFAELMHEATTNRKLENAYQIDMELSLEKFFEKRIPEQINLLEPYGVGNKRPVFIDPDVQIYDYKLLGSRGDHIKLFFQCKYSNRQGMGFNLGHKKDILKEPGKRRIIYSPSLNRYKNRTSWEVRVLDIL
jgi:single-stranded-DNA-specific exonuclease